MTVVFFVFVGLALVLFNRRTFNTEPAIDIQQLREEGLLDERRYRGNRAFVIEDFEDEGPHYVVELQDRSVLILTGQYLYEYEPVDDDPEFNQPRRFPCTDFTVVMRRDGGYSLYVECRGEVFEPEVVLESPALAGIASKKRDKRGRPVIDWANLPGDGDLITDRTYDDLKAAAMASDSGV